MTVAGDRGNHEQDEAVVRRDGTALRARGDEGRGLYVPLGTIATILIIIVLLMIIF